MEPKLVWNGPGSSLELRGYDSYGRDYCIATQSNMADMIDLMEKISALAPYLEDIFLAYRKYEYCSDDEEELVLTRRDKQLMRTYEYWHDSNFDEYPQLGYDWSVGYMLSFWEAADAVLDALEDDNYEVYTVASY